MAARPRDPNRIRIGELTRRTGVSRATIQHWLAEGLLPRPHKTGRTMAWYDVSTVERVQLVQALQARHLPLHVIRDMLETPPRRRPPRMLELARHLDELESLLAPKERPLRRAEVTRETGISAADVTRLEGLGLVRARGAGGDEFGPCDAAVLRAIGRLGGAGLDRSRGFSVDDLVLYRDAMQELIAREVALFARAPVSRDDFVRLAHAAAVGASELVAALHRKLVTDHVLARARNRR